MQGTRRLGAEGQEAHGMMDDEGNGDKKVVPMLLKNIQFQGSQPQTTAEAAKRFEEAFRRGAATNGIKTKRGPMSYDVQMFAPCTMSKHDPQGRGVRWAAKAGITHVMTQPMWNRRSRVYNSEKDKWMITDEGKILVEAMTSQLGKDFMVLPAYYGVAEKRQMEIKVHIR